MKKILSIFVSVAMVFSLFVTINNSKDVDAATKAYTKISDYHDSKSYTKVGSYYYLANNTGIYKAKSSKGKSKKQIVKFSNNFDYNTGSGGCWCNGTYIYYAISTSETNGTIYRVTTAGKSKKTIRKCNHHINLAYCYDGQIVYYSDTNDNGWGNKIYTDVKNDIYYYEKDNLYVLDSSTQKYYDINNAVYEKLNPLGYSIDEGLEVSENSIDFGSRFIEIRCQDDTQYYCSFVIYDVVSHECFYQTDDSGISSLIYQSANAFISIQHDYGNDFRKVYVVKSGKLKLAGIILLGSDDYEFFVTKVTDTYIKYKDINNISQTLYY